MKNFLLFIAILIISSLCLTDDNKGNGYSENTIISKDEQILKNENASYQDKAIPNNLQISIFNENVNASIDIAANEIRLCNTLPTVNSVRCRRHKNSECGAGGVCYYSSKFQTDCEACADSNGWFCENQY
jgi:hypothetical protein